VGKAFKEGAAEIGSTGSVGEAIGLGAGATARRTARKEQEISMAQDTWSVSASTSWNSGATERRRDDSSAVGLVDLLLWTSQATAACAGSVAEARRAAARRLSVVLVESRHKCT
jgi:hypothetical protein